MGEPALIFAVDDDASFLTSIVRLLCSNGLQVEAFPSAEALQQHGDLSRAACLLLDIHLGGISGIELHQQLKRNGSSVPVVFMTGSDSTATRRVAEEQGCFAYLQKPFAESDLMNVVTRAVTSRDM